MIASSSRLVVATPKRIGSATVAGSVTDEQFQAAFSATTSLKISSTKALIAEFQKHALILENVNNDWNKRVKSLQILRSLLISGAEENSDFISQCYTLIGTALQLSVKDLRSQVCREACITVAFYCEKLGTHFWRVAEILIPTLMLLSQNSAKVMATSSVNACHYIAKYVKHVKIATLLMSFATSKSKDMRRSTASLIIDIITNWDAFVLEKCWPDLISSLKSSLYDADVETRALGRQSFEALQQFYPQRAEFLFQELDPAKQRMLAGRSSTASSTHSINSERENLQAPSRGLYAAAQQNAFLSKRSTSDLNHSVRKMNLGVSQRIRPNVIRSAKPPQASSTLPKSSMVDHAALTTKKILPNVIGIARNSQNANVAVEKIPKATSQPGSRSTSPNRFRAPRSQVAHTTEKKIANGSTNSTSTFASSRNYSNNTPVANFKQDIAKALKNVDIQSRNIRQNSVKTFEDSAYGLSPTTGFVNRNIAPNRFSDSPNGDVDFYDKSRYSNSKNSSQNNNLSGDKWLYKREMLLNDPQEQEQYVNEICNVLQNNSVANCNEKEVEMALSAFSHMIRDGALNSWDDYFSRIFLSLIQSISQQNNYAIKLSALRALKDLCLSQPHRLVQKPELAMINVLNAHDCEDASVVRVAEECGAVLANNLPVDVCLKLLLAVVDDEKTAYHQLAGAIKMLSRVLEKLPAEDVQKLLPSIVGRMMKCYENSQSMVRRASIICLVAISNSTGIETLKYHLNASTLKLVEVYRDRMTKGK